MDFSKLFQPQNGKLLVLIVAFLIVYRIVYFLIFDDALSIYCSISIGDQQPVCQPQPGLLGVFNAEFPAVLFTILWPLIFASVNALHKDIRISPVFFYSITSLHFFATFVTFLFFLSSYTAQTDYAQQSMFTTAVTVVCATVISSAASIWVYYKKVMMFESAPKEAAN